MTADKKTALSRAHKISIWEQNRIEQLRIAGYDAFLKSIGPEENPDVMTSEQLLANANLREADAQRIRQSQTEGHTNNVLAFDKDDAIASQLEAILEAMDRGKNKGSKEWNARVEKVAKSVSQVVGRVS